VQLRDDLKSGELSLAVFAADLYAVAMGEARPVYQDPGEFFALTYPTFNLRELAKDVVTRLAGKSEKAVRQLELTYGGGKTHTLITLYHLAHDPEHLPGLPAVQEFKHHIGLRTPRARIALLAFDKLDVEKGMKVRGPLGETRQLRHPWSILAFQLAGDEGLRLLHAEGAAAERESAPAENLLVELLSLPQQEGLATLILIDEVLMYAREKVGLDPIWRGRIVNFFQYLTQAATKVDRCAIVASLLATDPAKSDTLGKELTQEMYAVFRREKEEGVQPVLKEDVAEVLRRRFFTPDSIRDREAFRPHVVAALQGIMELDEQTRKGGKEAEERFLKSYPFHPDLTEVFYSKWTNLEGFQRTRGVLRTFGLALGDTEKWDEGPLVGANVFLAAPGVEGLSKAGQELTGVAAAEEYQGKKQAWTAILEGELAKAREIQAEYPGLRQREMEQAVFATFLHSQPVGQKALTRELLVLLGASRPDRIELEKALRRWTEVSWFLDESAVSEAETGPDGQRRLPKSWRLGSKPNLIQMHHDACQRVPPDLIESRLLDEIGAVKSLTAGAAASQARVHNLPVKPSQVEDDGEFHYAVLGPKAASAPDRPGAEVRRFLEETTGPDRPRVNRNSVVLAVPSVEGLEAARSRIREYLGWQEVQAQLKGQAVDPLRDGVLAAHLDQSKRRVPEAIQQAYSLVGTISEQNEIVVFKVNPGGDSLFNLIKADLRSRIQETAVSPDALLPGGPYALWREGETSRWVKDLVGAFAQSVHLPKMLSRQAILDTLVLGCTEGLLVLRLTRPDRSVLTYWREKPQEFALKDPGLEAVLPEVAEITQLPYRLLLPNVLPGLWTSPQLLLREVYAYFAGGTAVQVERGGYQEPLFVPKASRSLVEKAVETAVREGKLWLTAGPASLWAEEVPAGLLTDAAILQSSPPPLSPTEILPASMPEAWTGEGATALSLAAALSQRQGMNLPWAAVKAVIEGALRAKYLELAANSAPWPCEFSGAQGVRLQVSAAPPLPPPPLPPGPTTGVYAEAELRSDQLQSLGEQMSALVKAAAGLDLRFRLCLSLEPAPSKDLVDRLNAVLREVAPELELK
jgi:hypothetical protein